MAIIIQNISKEYSKTDWQDYQIRINDQLICKFKHKASDGLAQCLNKASMAVEKVELSPVQGEEGVFFRKSEIVR